MKKSFLKNLAAAAMTIVVFGLATAPFMRVKAEDPRREGGYGLANAKAISATPESVELLPMLTSLINLIMGLLGIIAVLLILWGGFIYMTAAGDDDKTKKSKNIIISGIIGIIIIFAAWAIASFVINNMFNAATGTGA